MPAKVLPGQRKSVNYDLNKQREKLTQLRVAELEMSLAKRRGELVERKLIEAQASYLLVCLRQKVLAVPGAWARKLVGIENVEAAAAILREMTHSWLEVVADLPSTIADENWLATVAGDGEEPQEERVKPSMPGEAKAQAEKRSRRREAKTQTMRERRAKA